MTTLDTFPDVEGALRIWLRGQTACGNRVFFGVPRDAVEASFPLIVVQRIGGGDDTFGDAPVDNALMQVDVWGPLAGGKASARAVVNTLRSLFKAMNGTTQLTTGLTAFGAQVLSDIWLPDPADDRPRYSMTVAVTAISS